MEIFSIYSKVYLRGRSSRDPDDCVRLVLGEPQVAGTAVSSEALVHNAVCFWTGSVLAAYRQRTDYYDLSECIFRPPALNPSKSPVVSRKSDQFQPSFG
jgi:hypothetical protein